MNKIISNNIEYNFTWLKNYQLVFEITVCKIIFSEIQISVRKISIINTSIGGWSLLV